MQWERSVTSYKKRGMFLNAREFFQQAAKHQHQLLGGGWGEGEEVLYDFFGEEFSMSPKNP